MPPAVTFEEVNDPSQAPTVAQLANVIWREHYTPIIGEEQVDYMLLHIHSEDTIRRELQDDTVQYFYIHSDNTLVGYLCIKHEQDKLFLSKIYVLSSERGSGIGKRSITLIKDIAMEHGLEAIRLTVNRDNSASIAAYQRMGFAITGELCADIGGGYVMDDYLMELPLKAA